MLSQIGSIVMVLQEKYRYLPKTNPKKAVSQEQGRGLGWDKALAAPHLGWGYDGDQVQE